MILEFKYNYFLLLVFSFDLKHIYLQKNELDFSYFSHSKDKLNGIIIEPKINEIENVTLSKQFFSKFNIEVKPDDWKMITSIQNIEKLYKFIVYSIIIKDEPTDLNIQKCDINDLPINSFPFLKWMIPLSLDSLVHKSHYNQILMY